MDPIRVEVFLSVPACSGGVAVRRLLDEVAQEYGEQMDVVYHQGRDARYEELRLASAPAVIVGDLVRFVGLCPTKEGLIAALREAGLK
ncbi:MAG: thioredoxin family protein [Actinomycetia bacterium]|nr:thioredoxin family protein [Actinomycetes bacterium]